MDYEATDRAALHGALLALLTCPRCRADLLPVASMDRVFGCQKCRETWFIEDAR